MSSPYSFSSKLGHPGLCPNGPLPELSYHDREEFSNYAFELAQTFCSYCYNKMVQQNVIFSVYYRNKSIVTIV